MVAHVVVPYSAENSSVRTRALHWIDRLVASGAVDSGQVLVHGPGFERTPVVSDQPVLLLRNVRRLTRGRAEERLLSRASIGVYDLDDGLPWDNGALPGLGRWWKRALPLSLVALRAARAADRIIVGNEVLADWAGAHCGDVRVIPTCIEPSDYCVKTDFVIDERQPVIGWIGSPATEGYVVDVAPALAEVHRRTGAVLEMISGPGSVPEELAGFTKRRRWTPASTTEIARWDVGIMPLREGVYERAKCGYKLLQYAASGVPAVGSPVGVNAPLLQAMDGLSPIRDDEWVDALVQVIGEPSARRSARARQGHGVAARYSYDAWESAWLEAVGW